MAVSDAGAATLHVWDVGKDPPVEGADPGKAIPKTPPKKKRLAKRVRVNALEPTPLENEHFVGHVMVLHRPREPVAIPGPASLAAALQGAGGGLPRAPQCPTGLPRRSSLKSLHCLQQCVASPTVRPNEDPPPSTGRPVDGASKSDDSYAWYFSGKTRVWEVRVQGRFKTAPRGTVYAGSIFEEFNYAVTPARGAKILMGIGRRLIDKVLGLGMHISWGARQAAAAERDAPLAVMVAPLVGFDQIVRTRAGEQPPALQADISAHGVRRNAVGSTAEWRSRVAELTADLGTTDTFTFCSWGCSRFVNLADWKYTGMLPRSVSMSTLCDEWPLHIVLYAHDGAAAAEGDLEHRESRKVYFMDLLIWSSRTPDNPVLNELYEFED